MNEERPHDSVDLDRRALLTGSVAVAASYMLDAYTSLAEAAERVRRLRTPLQQALFANLKAGREVAFTPAIADDVRTKWMQQYESIRGRKFVGEILGRMEPHEEAMVKTFDDAKVPRQHLYLCIIESGFQRDAVSAAGAVGYYQFLETTAKRWGLVVDADKKVDGRRDPVLSATACAKYLRFLFDMYQKRGASDDGWKLAVSTYNGSFAHQYMEQATPPVTYAGYAAYMEKLFRKRIADPNSERTYTVREGDSVWKIAKRFSIAVGTLQEANKLTAKSIIHPRQVLMIPAIEKDAVPVYIVKSGETLSDIAKYLSGSAPVKGKIPVVSVQDIKSENGLTGDIIKPQQRLKVPQKSPRYADIHAGNQLALVNGFSENAEYLLKFEGLVEAMKKGKLGIFKNE